LADLANAKGLLIFDIRISDISPERPLYPKNGYWSRSDYALQFMDRSGPRIRANRKDQKALLALLRTIRVEAGMRQVDMAEALKVPQSHVSKYESGERRLDILELRAVCEAAHITLAEFGRRIDELLG
jgi:DNA-binding transcriptional regulator YiaG